MLQSDIDGLISKLLRQVVPSLAKMALLPSVNFRKELNLDSVSLLNLIFLMEENLQIDMFHYVDRLGEAQHLSDLAAIARDALQAQTTSGGGAA